jgi:hypothetical protein
MKAVNLWGSSVGQGFWVPVEQRAAGITLELAKPWRDTNLQSQVATFRLEARGRRVEYVLKYLKCSQSTFCSPAMWKSLLWPFHLPLERRMAPDVRAAASWAIGMWAHAAPHIFCLKLPHILKTFSKWFRKCGICFGMLRPVLQLHHPWSYATCGEDVADLHN